MINYTSRLSNRGRVLINLKSSVSCFKIPDLIVVSVIDYKNNNNEMLSGLSEKFKTEMLAVRSSSSSEDRIDNSHAGEFHSILNVPGDNLETIIESISTVIASYELKRPLVPEVWPPVSA